MLRGVLALDLNQLQEKIKEANVGRYCPRCGALLRVTEYYTTDDDTWSGPNRKDVRMTWCPHWDCKWCKFE
jgi:hypothetical protein